MHVLLLSLCLGTQGVQEPATLRGGAWLPRLGGTITDGGGAIDYETNIDMRDREVLPLLEFQVEPIDDIVVALFFFDFSTSGNGTFVGGDTYGGMVMTNGDAWSASTDIQSVSMEAAWEVWEPYKSGDDDTLSFAPVVGLQWFGVKTNLTNVTNTQSRDHQNSWIALQGGLQMDFRWDASGENSPLNSIGIQGQVMAGAMMGGDGGGMVSIQAGLSLGFTESASAFFGYRLQELSADDGAYTFDAGLQGLFVGAEIRF
ncbi:MAG: hypothetical protein HOH93_01925 [Phycisphaerae bacterium]|jgi:hypothetical protein|nr:hypothetical protein [Phycisphaerae bacterium]MBT6164651.1 hypothetical protein [Phycisphaerae bacterium]